VLFSPCTYLTGIGRASHLHTSYSFSFSKLCIKKCVFEGKAGNSDLHSLASHSHHHFSSFMFKSVDHFLPFVGFFKKVNQWTSMVCWIYVCLVFNLCPHEVQAKVNCCALRLTSIFWNCQRMCQLETTQHFQTYPNQYILTAATFPQQYTCGGATWNWFTLSCFWCAIYEFTVFWKPYANFLIVILTSNLPAYFICSFSCTTALNFFHNPSLSTLMMQHSSNYPVWLFRLCLFCQMQIWT
jgi:hypothetical protein